MKIRSRLALGIALLSVWSTVFGQAFPNKPVHIVIGFAPGGVIDAFARQLGPKLADALGQPVIIDNKPGANGVLAMDYVAKAPRDGHTIFMGALGNLSLNNLFYAKLPYDFERDFAPVTQVNSVSFLLATNAAVPAKNVAELISLTKARPGAVNYSSTGSGSTPNLAGELFNSLASVRAAHIAYKGSGQSMTDLLAGQVQFTFDAVAIIMPQVETGKLRVLATTGPRRLASLPNVPTMAESLPGYEVTNWYGIVVPRGTPREAIARIRDEVAKAVKAPDMRDKMIREGMEPIGSTPEEFGAFMKVETTKWAKVIKDSGMKID